MSYQKTPDLPGAYYGPSIPPPSYHHGRRHSNPCNCCLLDCLCSCLGNCGCCILSCIFQIICTILIFIGFIIFIFWLIFRPHELKFTSNSAVLTSFNVTSSKLTHNLAVNFTVRNPNTRIGVYYDEIEANEFYGDERISTVVYGEKFYQGHKNTTWFGPVEFKGRDQMVKFDGDLKSKFDKELSDGVYEIVVRLHLKVRFKIGWFKLRDYRMKVKCDLNVPLVGKSSVKFEETKCHYYI